MDYMITRYIYMGILFCLPRQDGLIEDTILASSQESTDTMISYIMRTIHCVLLKDESTMSKGWYISIKRVNSKAKRTVVLLPQKQRVQQGKISKLYLLKAQQRISKQQNSQSPFIMRVLIALL